MKEIKGFKPWMGLDENNVPNILHYWSPAAAGPVVLGKIGLDCGGHHLAIIWFTGALVSIAVMAHTNTEMTITKELNNRETLEHLFP